MRAPFFAPALLTTALLSTALAFPVHAEEKRELDSHEHGHVKLEIAVQGDEVAVALEAPGENIVGFEHAPSTDEQKAAVDAAVKQMSDPTTLFTLTEAAGCEVKSSEAEIHQEGDHNAFEATYAFTCANVAALTSIETMLFTLYPSIEEIDVDYATPSGQGSAELEADAPVLTLPTTS